MKTWLFAVALIGLCVASDARAQSLLVLSKRDHTLAIVDAASLQVLDLHLLVVRHGSLPRRPR